jgi:phage tail-like protein
VSSDGQPLPSSRFRVEVEGLERSGATEVVLPEARIVAEPGAAGEGAASVRFGPLVLRRGMLTASEWFGWWSAARRAPADSRRRVTIVLMDHRGADAQRWTVADAVPAAYSVSPLSATDGQPVVETLELSVGDVTADFSGR